MAGKAKFKIGERFRVKTAIPGAPNYIVGQTYLVAYVNGVNVADSSGYWIPNNYVDKVCLTREELLKTRTTLMDQIAEVDSRISFMNDVGMDVYNEEEAKVYHVVAKLEDGSLNRVQKAKEIVKLLKDIS